MNFKSITLLAAVAACLAIIAIPTSALAIPRDVVLSRGNVWVNHVQKVDSKGRAIAWGVPYSQSRWAKEDGSMLPTSTASPSTKGYRTDCSGFASLCWNLKDSSGHPYSTSTSEMGQKGSKKFFQIAKSQLQPGDAMLKSTVWGAPVGHVIIFAGWVDSSQKSYWCMEQTSSSSHNGTIYHTRPYGESYYRPYRYSGLEDMYSDVMDTVSAADSARAAASAACSGFPTTKSGVAGLVVVGAGRWQDQVAGAAIAGALGGPVLTTSATSLSASTTAEIKRLKPARIFVLGSTSSVSGSVVSSITSMCATTVRINGRSGFALAAAAVPTVVALSANTTHPVDTAYVVNGDESDEAMSVAPLAARTGRPILFVHQTAIPSVNVTKLRAAKIKKVVILGGTKVVSKSVERKLRSLGFSVSRVSGVDRYKTSVAIAQLAIRMNIGFSWAKMGVTSPSAKMDALAWGSAMGRTGTVVTLSQSKKLDAAVRRTAAAYRAQIGRARVFGGSAALSYGARKTLATALRTGK